MADAFIYHLYPLGALGAPTRNAAGAPPADRIRDLYRWLDPIRELGADTLLLGPVFESATHGYDTIDLRRVDRRLGDDAAFAAWCAEARRRGLRIVLDGVFHHVGRDFPPFRDVREHGRASAYRDWFHLDFGRRSPAGDPFHYEGWNGHYDLVKLNLDNPRVREHLFDAVRGWIAEFGIAGLRLDAADSLDIGFQRDLAAFCRGIDPDFWLLAEVIHGDYRRWLDDGGLDSVTNYQLYKALYSSHNDRNYFELAHALAREFGPEGMYRGRPLYTFVDNHDVPRIASVLKEPAHLGIVQTLLFTVPGIPAVYYGSEWGIEGRKGHHTDAPLRPALDPDAVASAAPHPGLRDLIRRLAALRRASPALRRGDYTALHVAHQQFAFARPHARGTVVVAVNAATEPCTLRLALDVAAGRLADLLDGPGVEVAGGTAAVALPPHGARILAH